MSSIEHVEKLHYRLTEQVPRSDIEDIFERILRRRSESGESIEASRQRLQNQAWADAMVTARDVTYKNALKHSGLRPVSEAQFAWQAREDGESYLLSASFEVLPLIDISRLNEIEVEQPTVDVTDDDVSRALDILLSEHKTYKPVFRPAQVGDRVIFDYDGKINGTSFDGSHMERARAVIGEGDMLEDMELALVGRSADDNFKALITFPEDYATPGLRRKEVEFRIVIHEVAAPEFPTLDTNLVKRLGGESGSVEALRSQLHQQLTSEAERRRGRFERQQLTDALLDTLSVTVPDTLLEHEIEQMRAIFDSKPSAPASGSDANEELPEQPLRQTAERRVALSLILSEIIREHDIRLDQARVDEKLDELAARFPFADAQATKRQYKDDTQLMHSIQALVIEEQGLETAFERVRKTPVSMSLDMLLHRTETQ